MQNEHEAGSGCSSYDLFADLERRFGEDNGGSEVFDLIAAATISCRYADLCIMQDSQGWHYGPCPEAYPTHSECYANHREDLVRFHSANVRPLATGESAADRSGEKRRLAARLLPPWDDRGMQARPAGISCSEQRIIPTQNPITMNSFANLPQCPIHGHFIGKQCPYCDYPQANPVEPKAEVDTYDRTNWHRGPEKELHEWFETEMIRIGVSYVHGRMDKESTIRKGWPDFSLFCTAEDGITRACFVELKSKTTAILKDQVEVIAELKAMNIPVIVTGNFTEAVEFVKKNLEINQKTK